MLGRRSNSCTLGTFQLDAPVGCNKEATDVEHVAYDLDREIQQTHCILPSSLQVILSHFPKLMRIMCENMVQGGLRTTTLIWRDFKNCMTCALTFGMRRSKPVKISMERMAGMRASTFNLETIDTIQGLEKIFANIPGGSG